MAQEWSFVGIEHVQVPGVDGDRAVNVPAGVQDGDLLILATAAFDSGTTPTIGEPTVGTWQTRHDDASILTNRWRHRIWDKIASSEPGSYTVNFSIPGGNDVDGGVLILMVYRGIGGFDTSAVTNHTSDLSLATPALSITNPDSLLISIPFIHSINAGHADTIPAQDTSGFHSPAVAGGLTERLDHNGLAYVGVYDKHVGVGSSGDPRVDIDSSQSARHYALAYRGIIVGEAALQAVATITPDAQLSVVAEALLQGVATVAGQGTALFGGDAALQGVSRITAEGEGVPFLDFTTYDAYIETEGGLRGLLFYDEQKPETVPVKLQPVRQDVGNNPEEIRPEFGNFFAQSDFSHGAGQRYFHQPGRDPKKAFYLEGFDISEPGKLAHLRAIAEANSSATIGVLAQVGDLPFVINGNRVDRGDGTFPGAWTPEDPSGGEADQIVEDITAEGDRLFAAIGTGGVHVRSAAGVWTHYQPDAVIDLDITPATRVAWLKERLLVVGNTGSRSIYEVTNDSTILATPIETLPEGWEFVDIFEAGGFVHACAVNVDAGMSRIHHYGLDSTGAVLEKKSSTPFPQGQLMYAGAGFPGLAFLAGGVRNSSGGYDPILYRAGIVNERGELDYIEVRQETGAGAADLSVRAIVPMGESILMGWSLGSGAFGGARDGIAVYHIARDAFAHHLKRTGAGSSQRIADIMPFRGRILISITGDGLFYEDLSTYVATAQVVTSLADWNNAGQKVWDQVEISNDPLPAGASVKVEYATQSLDVAVWSEVFTSDVDGAEGSAGQVSNVKARVFALRITSTSAVVSPVFLGYSVRSLPSPVRPEFQLTRYVRILSIDRKDEDATVVSVNPRTVLRLLQDAIYSFVNFYESGFSWTAWLEDVSTVEPAQPFYESTSGEPLRDAFVVRLQMTGAR